MPDTEYPTITVVYVDEYVPATAELEVLTSLILNGPHGVKGDPKLFCHFLGGLKVFPTVVGKTVYCRNFLKDMEAHRAWCQFHAVEGYTD